MNTIGDTIKRLWAHHEHQIILAAGVFLISLISFVAGYLYASQTLKESIQFEGFSDSKPDIEQAK